MPKLSIASTFLIVTYFAICALNYASENVGIGWLIVAATAMVIAVATFRSFITRDAFGLGFSVCGGFWLAIVLGFAIETPTSFKPYDLRPGIYRVMSFGRTRPKIVDYTNLRESTYHDLHDSIGMVRRPDVRDVPNRRNSLTLVACWSALIAGLIGGFVFSSVMKSKERITSKDLTLVSENETVGASDADRT